MKEECRKNVKVGSKVWFHGEKLGYTVQARDENFLICNKPFNPRKTVLYCIVDFEKNIRGPENLVLGMGAETKEDCEEMLARLNLPEMGEHLKTEVSHRHYAPLYIVKYKI